MTWRMREEAMSGIIIPVCLLLAVAGVALGLVLRLPSPSLRLKPRSSPGWSGGAITPILGREHHIERADTPCGASFCPPGEIPLDDKSGGNQLSLPLSLPSQIGAGGAKGTLGRKGLRRHGRARARGRQ
jgi:hypothetical protein